MTGISGDPEWRMISSEYPETRERFLVLAVNEEEMLVEKIIAMIERKKGRDLYDFWFLLKRDVKVDEKLFNKKSRSGYGSISLLLRKVMDAIRKC